jgi:hypothetical protein
MAETTFTPRRTVPKKIRKGVDTVFATGLALFVLIIFLIPMVYGIVTALKTDSQFSKIGAPWWPATEGQFEYEGKMYEVYLVPIDGKFKEMAIIRKGRANSDVVDIHNPEAGVITWEGAWRSLERTWMADPQWDNFPRAWNTIKFPLYWEIRSCMPALPLSVLFYLPRLWHMALLDSAFREEYTVHVDALNRYSTGCGYIDPDLFCLSEIGLGRYLAAVDHTGLFRMGYQCILAAAVLPLDPARTGRSSHDGWG